MRVLPIYASWSTSPSDCENLQDALSQSDRKLRGEAPHRSLDELAETAYRIAALAATEFRKSGAELAGRATIAGSIIHSAIDAIADLGSDDAAVLANSMLALRGCAKLKEPELAHAVIQDLQTALQNTEIDDGLVSDFGPLWPRSKPAW
jgi:hypothetical protein